MSDPNATPNVTPTASDTAVTPAPATTGTPAVGANPTVNTQTPATGVVQEDRSNWVPPHRVRETREAAQREFAAREAAYQARLDQLQKNLQALTGVQPPQNPEIDAVKSQFGKLYPGLTRIESKAEQIERLFEKMEAVEAQNQHYWSSHAQNTIDRLHSVAEESTGKPLTPEAKQQLFSSFVGYIQTNPDLEARYQNDSANLVKDFWKAFSSQFIDPYRRADAAAAVNRIPSGLPQDTPGGAPQATPVAKHTSLDERANDAWARFKATTSR